MITREEQLLAAAGCAAIAVADVAWRRWVRHHVRRWLGC